MQALNCKMRSVILVKFISLYINYQQAIASCKSVLLYMRVQSITQGVWSISSFDLMRGQSRNETAIKDNHIII